MRDEPVADPSLIRSLDTGQAAYLYRGEVTFVQIKRLVAAPAALPREPPPAAADADGGPGAATHLAGPAPPTGPPAIPLPHAGALLDEAFGQETD
jgi:hypothetical protein